MTAILRIASTLGALLLVAAPIAAQTPPDTTGSGGTTTAQEAPPADPRGRTTTIQHVRPQDQRGINVFESPKEPGVEYTGFKLDFGAAFTSQVQSLNHTAGKINQIYGRVDR